MTMMTMMTVIDNVVDHYTYQTRWGQKRTHAKIHPVHKFTILHLTINCVSPCFCICICVLCTSSEVSFLLRIIFDDSDSTLVFNLSIGML